jgi:copper chaperone
VPVPLSRPRTAGERILFRWLNKALQIPDDRAIAPRRGVGGGNAPGYPPMNDALPNCPVETRLEEAQRRRMQNKLRVLSICGPADADASIGHALFKRYRPEKWKVKFSIKNEIRADDIPTIEQAMKSVDGDAKVDVDIEAKTVSVDSWLMPEEFFVAFDDENYEVTILEA